MTSSVLYDFPRARVIGWIDRQLYVGDHEIGRNTISFGYHVLRFITLVRNSPFSPLPKLNAPFSLVVRAMCHRKIHCPVESISNALTEAPDIPVQPAKLTTLTFSIDNQDVR